MAGLVFKELAIILFCVIVAIYSIIGGYKLHRFVMGITNIEARLDRLEKQHE